MTNSLRALSLPQGGSIFYPEETLELAAGGQPSVFRVLDTDHDIFYLYGIEADGPKILAQYGIQDTHGILTNLEQYEELPWEKVEITNAYGEYEYKKAPSVNTYDEFIKSVKE